MVVKDSFIKKNKQLKKPMDIMNVGFVGAAGGVAVIYAFGDSGWTNGGGNGGMSYNLASPDRTLYFDGGNAINATDISVSFSIFRDWSSWLYMRIDMIRTSGTTTVFDSGRSGDGTFGGSYSNVAGFSDIIGFKMFSRSGGGANKKHKLNSASATLA
jgi:hypothetical protein